MRTLLFLTTVMILICTSCGKDEDTNACENLPGTWTCTSWIEDTEQFFGDTIYIIGAELDFKPIVDGQGDVTWDLSYLVGGPIHVVGSYTLNESCNEVSITPKGGVSTTYQFSIDGDVLTLEGNINNVDIEMQYTRN